MSPLDCLIIGAGPAGLTAAIYLARFRRDVLVIDGGSSRAQLIPRSYNYPGFPEGINGSDFLERLRSQAESCGVQSTNGQVIALRKVANLFQINTNEGIFFARTVILATGIKDRRLPMDDWEGNVSKGIIRLCPICDAYDNADQNIAIVSSLECAVTHAQFLRTYFKCVSLYLYPPRDFSSTAMVELSAAHIKIPQGGFEFISVQNEKPQVRCSDGSHQEYDSVYVMLGEAASVGLIQAIGASFNREGKLLIDEHQSSSVKGLYAIGDVVSSLHQVSVATGQAAIAATHIHNSLERNFCEQ